MKNIIYIISLLLSLRTEAQEAFRAVVKDAKTGELLEGVSATATANLKITRLSNSRGAILLAPLPAGIITIDFSFTGYQHLQLLFTLPDTIIHEILLHTDEKELANVVVVASTRGNERIENATTKVEVIGGEEMNEETMVKPGNITSILGDLSGVQIQQSSATSGNANIRIQGLDGRYTQMLRDGIPLYDGFSGGFGVLSLPPLDLKQLELIKGAASTLYGGGAIGGLVNFISKKPGYTPQAALVLNQTSLNETNINAYYDRRWKKIGLSVFAGQTWQQQADVDKDGLSDVAKSTSTVLHPVIFIYPSEKSYVSVGWSANFDEKLGGDMIAIAAGPGLNHSYFEKNLLNRNTVTLIAENRFNAVISATFKSAYSRFHRNLYTNSSVFGASQDNFYSEATLSLRQAKHSLVAGINITGDHFKPDVATPVPVGNVSNTTVGIFAQDGFQWTSKTKLETGLRIDRHTRYGIFVLPHFAVFHRFNDVWGTRAGFGMGYKTPNPLTPQNKDLLISSIQPLGSAVTPEKSYGVNAEINFRKNLGTEGRIFINNAFFITKIDNPVIATENTAGKVSFDNQPGPIVTRGIDTYIQLKMDEWEYYIGYTYTIAKREYLKQNQFMPLTPRNRLAGTLVYEVEDQWRFGLEASWTGSQYRDGDSKTPGYLFMAAMIEKKFGSKLSLVLNCENLLDKRQSRYEQIFTGSIQDPDYKPLWAPIDGRIVNLAIRYNPFAALH